MLKRVWGAGRRAHRQSVDEEGHPLAEGVAHRHVHWKECREQGAVGAEGAGKG